MDRRGFLKLLAASTALANGAVSYAAGTGSLLLFGVDGADYEVVMDLSLRGLLPNISSLGIRHLNVTGPTCTTPSWSEVFTGLAPEQSGVWSNKPIDVNLPYVRDYSETHKAYLNNFWIAQIPFERSIFPYLGGVRYGAIVSKNFLWTEPERTPLAQIFSTLRLHELYHPRIGDHYIDLIRDRAIRWLVDRQESYFLFVHVNADYYGHIHGGRSERYKEEIIRADRLLGQLRAILPPETKTICMSDHGFDSVDTGERGTHKNAPHAFIATDLPLQPGEYLMRDVAPTILTYFGNKIDHLRGMNRL